MKITSSLRFLYIIGCSGPRCGRSRCTAVGPRLALKLNIDSMTSLPGSLLEFQMSAQRYRDANSQLLFIRLVQEFGLTTQHYSCQVKTFLVDNSTSCLLKRDLSITQLYFLLGNFFQTYLVMERIYITQSPKF